MICAMLMVVHGACQDGQLNLTVQITEFAKAYQKVLSMSDGSFVDPQENQHMRGAFEKMLVHMEAVGVTHEQPAGENYSLAICHEQIPEVLLLSVLGNFVTRPDTAREQLALSYRGTIATVVVDRSGDLVVKDSLDAMRSFYLETLLFLSVLAIARLSIINTGLTSQNAPFRPSQFPAQRYTSIKNIKF